MTKSKPLKSKWRPAPEKLIQLFNNALSEFPEAQLRKTFGYPSAMINGYMFTGLHQESMILKLPTQDRSELMERGAKPFEPMPGRTMGEFIVVPDGVLHSEDELNAWLKRSFEYVKSLPPKKK